MKMIVNLRCVEAGRSCPLLCDPVGPALPPKTYSLPQSPPPPLSYISAHDSFCCLCQTVVKTILHHFFFDICLENLIT